jgi:cytochrome P450
LIFQLTVRALSCAEIADDADTVARLKSLYDTLDRGYTPAAVLAPWLPSPAILRNTWTTKRIHDIIVTAIENRKKSGKSGNDTLQMLLDQNTEPRLIVGFMLGLIVAGSRSTGTTGKPYLTLPPPLLGILTKFITSIIASWMLTFIGSHREWRDRSRAELEALLTSHGSASTDAPISEQLASIPLDAWEQHTPVLDSIIRETLRLAQPHVAMRRNLGPDVYIDGNIIPTGSYIVYPYSDVHLNPEIYPEPLRFDPTRRLETKETSYAYVGFGGGKISAPSLVTF